MNYDRATLVSCGNCLRVLALIREAPDTPPRTECPYCGRLMSDREKREQGGCDDCTGGTIR